MSESHGGRSASGDGPAISFRVRALFYLAEGLLGGAVLYAVYGLGSSLLPALVGERSRWVAGFLGVVVLFFVVRVALFVAVLKYRGESRASREWRSTRRWLVVFVTATLVGVLLVTADLALSAADRPGFIFTAVLFGGVALYYLAHSRSSTAD